MYQVPLPGPERVRPDDEIYQADRSFLGPAPYTLPFRIPYRSLPVAAAVFIPCLLVMRVLGATGLPLYGLALGASCGAAALVVRFTGPERPVSAMLAILAREVTAAWPSRRPAAPATEVLRPGLVPAGPLPGPLAGQGPGTAGEAP
jgi:hypothetical protein